MYHIFNKTYWRAVCIVNETLIFYTSQNYELNDVYHAYNISPKQKYRHNNLSYIAAYIF